MLSLATYFTFFPRYYNTTEQVSDTMSALSTDGISSYYWPMFLYLTRGSRNFTLCACVSPAAFLKALICMQRGWETSKHTFCPRSWHVTMAAPRKCINIYGKGTKKSKHLCLPLSQFIPLFINLILEQLLEG